MLLCARMRINRTNNDEPTKRKGEKIMAKKTMKETKEVTRIVKLEVTAIENVSVLDELKTKEEVLELIKKKLGKTVDDVKILDMKTFEQ